MSADHQSRDSRRPTLSERLKPGDESWLVRLADIPWGLIVFLFVLCFGIYALVARDDLKANDFIAALAAGAGLLGVGHGIHTSARVRAASKREPATGEREGSTQAPGPGHDGTG